MTASRLAILNRMKSARRLGTAAFSLLTVLTVLSLLVTSSIQAPEVRAAGNIYVSSSGDDTSGDGTASNPYLTIAMGLAAAVPGDTVMVESGVYRERVDLKSGVTLRGSGASASVIDAELSGPAVTANDVTGAVLDGFGVTGGLSDSQGGGILVTNSTNVTIQNNMVFDNNVRGASDQSNGAGLLVINSSVSILRNTIQGNYAEYSGGGIYLRLDAQSAIVKHNLILGNGAETFNGGGISVRLGSTASVEIKNNQILSNGAFDSGAGLDIQGSGSGSIIANLIESCYTDASTAGGVGIFVQGDATGSPSLLIADNVIDSNTGGGDVVTGGGILVGWGVGPATRIVNNTITGNSAAQAGGLGVYYADSPDLPGSSPIIANNIIWGNKDLAGQPDDLSGVSVQDGALGATAPVAADYNLVGAGNSSGAGNISGDPGFIDPAAADFHLLAGSPAINAGDNASVDPALTTDFDGKPRIMGAGVDLGAYEVIAGTTWVINATAGAGGVIQPPGAIAVDDGGSQTFFIAPDPDYQIEGVFVDGVAVGAVGSYNFSGVTFNHTITATFAAVTTYTIVASAGANGTITPSGTISVQLGQSQEFVVTPDPGYHIASIVVDDIDVGPTNTHTFNNINADHTVSAVFAVNTYTLNVTSGPNGTITPSGTLTVNHGADQTFIVASNPGYHVVDVLVDGTSVGDANSYTLTDISASHSVAASFAIDTYTMTVSAGPNGSIAPTGRLTLSYGSNQTFTVTPNAGYHVADLLVDGVSVGAVGSYTLNNVTANHTIAASFALNTYTMNVSAGANGSISPSGSVSVAHGADQTFTLTPNAGYHVADVVVDGTSVGAVSSYTLNNVTANHTIAASFALNTYAIAASASDGGNISPSGNIAVNHGSSLTFTITPSAGYHVASVTVDEVSVGAVTSYTFTNVTGGHTIAAAFTVDSFTMTVSAGANGTIMPSGTLTLSYGADQTFSMTPDAGYHVADVLVDGASVGAVDSYTFNNITASHTIAASFSSTYTMTVSAGANGSITPSGNVTVTQGSIQTFTIAPNAGYHVADVLVDGVSVGAVTSYTLNNVAANHTIAASFAIDTYVMTVAAGANGSIAPSGMLTVNHGSDQTFTITPNAGYHVADVLVDGTSVGAVTGYTLNNVTANHSVVASFAINTYTMTVSAGANGSIAPSGTLTVNYGSDMTFTITPNDGYRLADVLVDGTSVGRVSSYTFDNITANHTIAASFTSAPLPATVTLSNLNQTYDGTAKVVTVSTDPAGLSVSVTYNGSAQAPTSAGIYAVEAVVTDPNYTGSAAGTLVIAKGSVNVALTASANPSVAGQPVTFIANVTPTAAATAPTGTVQFIIDGSPFGTPVALSGGSATSAPASALAAGSHTVTASYSGDTNYDAASSATLTQTVVGARSLKLQAIALLTPYVNESKRIEKAIEEIEDSLEPDLWLDETHVDAQHGQQVFDNERHAVQELTQLLNKGNASAAALAAAEQAIDLLVAADRLLAATLISDAGNATVIDPRRQDNVDKELADAAEALQEGDDARNGEEFDNAIDRYRQAWGHAGVALEEAAKPAGSVNKYKPSKYGDDDDSDNDDDEDKSGKDDNSQHAKDRSGENDNLEDNGKPSERSSGKDDSGQQTNKSRGAGK